MTRLLPLILHNLRRNTRNVVFSSVGIVVGTGLLTFFLALAAGIRANVLNRLYPVNQVEVEPRSVNFMGIREHAFADLVIDAPLLERVRAMPGVEGVFPKQRSKFQARLWGGQDFFGQELHLEGFFDGVDPPLLREELQDNEGGERRRVKERYLKRRPCQFTADCRASEVCLEGVCREREYWRAFEDHGDAAWCDSDAECLGGEACRQGHCLGSAPVAACEQDAACAPGFACVERACQRLACKLERPDDQFGPPARTRGHLLRNPDRTCPLGTYCAARSIASTEGMCEEPVPALLNPFILTVYNSTAAVALGLPRVSGVELVLGLRFRILFGNSFFVRDLEKTRQVVKQCEVVGFSTKALELGVTMPLSYVLRANARIRGGVAAAEYNSVIIQTARNEDIPAVVEGVRALGFELNDKSQAAQKAGTMLFILAVLFGFISALVLAVSAINITHTFLMVVYQRRREIGILRSVGASRGHVRTLFLGESVFVGLLGGLLGNGLALGLASLADALGRAYFRGLPFLPERFFDVRLEFLALSLALGVAFGVAGALIPANRAARMDPTVALGG
jgi:ABC-type lipoprotein release transport system permease subunit